MKVASTPSARPRARPRYTVATQDPGTPRHPVELARLRRVPRLPAAPGLEAAEQQDQEQAPGWGAGSWPPTRSAVSHEPGARERGRPWRGRRRSGSTGRRLNRFSRKPTYASAEEEVAPAKGVDRERHQRPPPIRQQGLPSPTRASAPASFGSSFIATTAPRNGMNIGALAGMPSRRSWITCPISWTRRSRTKPTRERPAPDERVRRDGHEHRARGGQDLELREEEQKPLELRGELERERAPAARSHPARDATAARAPLRRRRRGRARPAGAVERRLHASIVATSTTL